MVNRDCLAVERDSPVSIQAEPAVECGDKLNLRRLRGGSHTDDGRSAGKRIWVMVYQGGRYHSGEYFGQMPELAMRKQPAGYDDPDVAEEIWKHSDEY